MKKIFLIVTLVVATLASFAKSDVKVLNTENLSESKDLELLLSGQEKDLVVDIKIIWGRKSKGCKGFGICEIHLSIIYTSEKGSDDVVTSGKLIKSGNDIYLKIPLNEINKYRVLSSNLLNTSVVLLPEGTIVNSNIMSEVGYRSNITIEPGRYNVKCDRDNVILQLK